MLESIIFFKYKIIYSWISNRHLTLNVTSTQNVEKSVNTNGRSFYELISHRQSNFIQLWFQTIFYCKRYQRSSYSIKTREDKISVTFPTQSSYLVLPILIDSNTKTTFKITNLLQAIFLPLQRMTQTMVNQVCLL